jgi:hypothetical protein
VNCYKGEMWWRHLISRGRMSAAARTPRGLFHDYEQELQQPRLLLFSPTPSNTDDVEDKYAKPLTDRHGGCGISDSCLKKATNDFFLEQNLLPPFPKSKEDPCLPQIHLLLRERNALNPENTKHLCESDKARYMDVKRLVFPESKFEPKSAEKGSTASRAATNAEASKKKIEVESVKAELEALTQNIVRAKEAAEAAAVAELLALNLSAELKAQAAKIKAEKLKVKRQKQRVSKQLQKKAQKQIEPEIRLDDEEKEANTTKSMLVGVKLCRLSLENGHSYCCDLNTSCNISDQEQEESIVSTYPLIHECDDNAAGDCGLFCYEEENFKKPEKGGGKKFGDDFLRICEEKSAMEKKYVEAMELEEEKMAKENANTEAMEKKYVEDMELEEKKKAKENANTEAMEKKYVEAMESEEEKMAKENANTEAMENVYVQAAEYDEAMEGFEFEEENYEITAAFLLQREIEPEISIEKIFNSKIEDLVKCGDMYRSQMDPEAFQKSIKTLDHFVVLNDDDILQPMKSLQAYCLQKQPDDEEEEFAKELGQYHSPCPSCFEPFDLVQRLPMKSQCAATNPCIMCSECWVGFRMKRCMCGGEFFPLLWKVDCDWVVSCTRLQSIAR